MHHTKFRSNNHSRSGETVDFIGFAIHSTDGSLGFSTRLNFIILKNYSLVMQHMKFENQECSDFRE